MNAPAVMRPSAVAEPARFSEAEYFRMYAAGVFEGMRVDLVYGELERMAPSGTGHGGMLGQIAGRLYAAIDQTRFELFVDTFVRIGEALVRAPDISIVRRPVADAKALDVASIMLAVEVADTSINEDLGGKLRDYARAGIPHYWIADTINRQVRVLSQPDETGEYGQRTRLPFGEPLDVPEHDATITLA